MSEVARSIANFSNHLKKLSALQNEGKHSIGEAERQIFSILEDATKAIRMPSGENSGTSLRECAEQLVSSLVAQIDTWQKDMRKSDEVRRKLEEAADGLIVLVFGRTNAGKSTLGNFIRGKQLKDAPFDTAWKHDDFFPSLIRVVEAAKTAEKQTDQEWFKEGCTETTQEIQIFSLPGLCWVDTPGVSSVNDEELGALARDYAKRADLIIYLDLSSNPGLESNSNQLLSLFESGRQTLVLINHSDKVDYARDINGKIVKKDGKVEKTVVPKSEKDRKAQEEQVRNSLRVKGFKKPFDVYSISMLLAQRGIEREDDVLFKGSNLDALFSKLNSIIDDPANLRRLRCGDAVKALCEAADIITGEIQNGQSNLISFQKSMENFCNRVRDTYNRFDIDKEINRISNTILFELDPKIYTLVYNNTNDKNSSITIEKDNSIKSLFNFHNYSSKESLKKSISLNLDEINSAMKKICGKVILEKAKRVLQDLGQDAELSMSSSIPEVQQIELKRNIEHFSYEVTVTKYYTREPSGVIEHVCSWFGKTYRSSYLSTETRTQEIDHGFDSKAAIENLRQQYEKGIREYVRGELEHIRSDCLQAPLNRSEEMVKRLIKARAEIRELRTKLAKSLEESC